MGEAWRIWIDTGGTFTDGFALTSSGGCKRAKILSSSALRGTVVEQVGPSQLVVREHWGAPPGLVEGMRFFGLGRRPVFERCSIAFVRQLNMVPTLLEAGHVVSFAAPYFCPECEKERIEVLRPAEFADGEPPHRRCSSCQTEHEFDDVPESYFALLTDCPGTDRLA